MDYSDDLLTCRIYQVGTRERNQGLIAVWTRSYAKLLNGLRVSNLRGIAGGIGSIGMVTRLRQTALCCCCCGALGFLDADDGGSLAGPTFGRRIDGKVGGHGNRGGGKI